MDKDKVKEILSKINYPGFSRDIVSFGMVSGVEINLNEIIINLSITSQNSEKKSILVADIEKKYTVNTSELKILNEQINKLTDEHIN